MKQLTPIVVFGLTWLGLIVTITPPMQLSLLKEDKHNNASNNLQNKVK
jgi:hypothetical protein